MDKILPADIAAEQAFLSASTLAKYLEKITE